jgi:hypothetical protein
MKSEHGSAQKQAILGRPLADFFRNISFANPILDRDICALNHPLSPVCPFQETKRPRTTTPRLKLLPAFQPLYANIAGVISSTWMITSAGISLRRAAFLIASALSAS